MKYHFRKKTFLHRFQVPQTAVTKAKGDSPLDFIAYQPLKNEVKRNSEGKTVPSSGNRSRIIPYGQLVVLTCACFESLQTPTTTFFSSTWSPKSFISNTRMGGCSLNWKYKYHKNVHGLFFVCPWGVQRRSFHAGKFSIFFFSFTCHTVEGLSVPAALVPTLSLSLWRVVYSPVQSATNAQRLR